MHAGQRGRAFRRVARVFRFRGEQGQRPGRLPPEAERGGTKKLIEFARWWLTPGRLSCAECRERYAKIDVEPECDQCQPPPSLLPGNLEAFNLWMLVQDQIRPTPRGRAPLDLAAVVKVMEFLGMGGQEAEQRWEALEKIKIIHAEAVGMYAKK